MVARYVVIKRVRKTNSNIYHYPGLPKKPPTNDEDQSGIYRSKYVEIEAENCSIDVRTKHTGLYYKQFVPFSPNQFQRAKNFLYDFIDVLAVSYSPAVAYCETYYFVVLSPPTDDYPGAFQYIGLTYYMIQTLKNLEMEGYTENDAKTRNKKLVAVRCLYDYLLDQQEALGLSIPENPAARIRRPKVAKKQPIFLPEEDQVAFLEGISGENAVRDYALFLLMLSSGLRVSETVGLDLKDLNLDQGTCRIFGKGNKERIVHLTPACIHAIIRYKEEYRDLIKGLNTDALFVSKRYLNRLTVRSVQKALQKHALVAKLGGKGYTPHKLRHTTGTTLAKDGVDLLIIQKVLGHENPATTEIYTHLGNEDVARAVQGSSLAALGNKSPHGF